MIYKKDNVTKLLNNNFVKYGSKISVESCSSNSVGYEELLRIINSFIAKIANYGLKRGDKIVLIFKNKATMLPILISVFYRNVAIPANPQYTDKEFYEFVKDVKPRFIIFGEEIKGISKIAKTLNIAAICIGSNFMIIKKIGIKNLCMNRKNVCNFNNFSKKNQTALILPTSGTAGRPKLALLTHYNIIFSIKKIIEALELKENDGFLNIMPMCHIHSIMLSLASLMVGSRVIVGDNANSETFYNCTNKFKVSWYSASPTIHKAILDKYVKNKNKIKLRFVRSSVAPMPLALAKKIEEKMKVPLIESYGMTEAGLQITSNPLPPALRILGSVGKPVGTKVKIIDKSDKFVKKGKIGEIVISGDNVIKNYLNKKKSSKYFYKKKWLRTGDLGYFDKSGFLYIKGRIKELINSGGIKIFPREIDESLMNHPKIYQAVTFSIPHETLGEEVGAAVILKKNKKATEKEIKTYLLKKNAVYKVPKKIFFIDKIPGRSTGKLQRIGLYDIFKKQINVKVIDSRLNHTQRVILDIWRNVLNNKSIGINDNFFEIGGDSLKLAEVSVKLGKNGNKLDVKTILNYPTIRELSKVIKIN